MRRVLFLCHRIPYPPNKGDKVRSYHLLKTLAASYRVHLGTFIDDREDVDHVERVRAQCEDLHWVRLHPSISKCSSLRGLLTGEALTLPYYRDASMRRWVDRTLAEHRIDRIVVFSSGVASYVMAHLGPGVRSVADLVDVDSDKWRQYAASKPWPLSWLYRRESRTLLAYEREVRSRFSHTIFVTDEEVALFRRLDPGGTGEITALANGVDGEFFSPEANYDDPYERSAPVVAFTGAMDYWANVDAVVWFADEVLPALRAWREDVTFFVVGARPTDEVRALARRPGIEVTGTVPDIRAYIAHAGCCVAPLRIARGIQNKVLEAMAMARPVVVTTAALEGIVKNHPLGPFVGADAAGMASRIQSVLEDPAAAIAAGERNRAFVREHYDWNRNLGRISDLLEHRHDAAS